MVKPQMRGNQMGVCGVVLALVDMQQSTTQADRFGGGGAGVESVQTPNIRLPHKTGESFENAMSDGAESSETIALSSFVGCHTMQQSSTQDGG